MTCDLMIAGALVSLVVAAFYGALGGHVAPPPGSDGARDLTGMVDLRVTPPFAVEDGLEPCGPSRQVTDAIKRNLVADMHVSPRDYELDYIAPRSIFAI